MDIARKHAGWDRPFPLALADHLRRLAGDGGGYDHLLVWVPSARAGRHVLAQLFGGVGGTEAFHPPRLVTPAQYVAGLATHPAAASETRQLLAWKSVLLELPPSRLDALFPVIPRGNRDHWAFGVGQQLMRMRACLAEDGWDFGGIARSGLSREQERWGALARVEELYIAHLQQAGVTDPDDLIRGRLKEGLAASGFTRLLIAGVLNLTQRQQACAEALAASGLQVELCLPYPAEIAAKFDGWGRPLAGVWNREPLPGELIDGRLQRSAEPRELVARTLDLADLYSDNVDALVVGAPEQPMRDYLIERSRLTGSPFYAPEGRTLADTGWGRLVALVAEWQQGAPIPSVLEMLRHPLFRSWARRQGLQPGRVETALLELQVERLAGSLRDLADPAFRPDGRIGLVRDFEVQVLKLLKDEPGSGGFPSWLWRILAAIAAGAELASDSSAILGQFEEILQELAATFDSKQTSAGDYWEILSYLMRSRFHYPEREASERPVAGWLELPWETAPHMVILGLPDSEVPGTGATDTFLTPSLCRAAGLYGPEQAEAFHAFRLRLVLECRRNWGRVDILLADRGMDDNPVLPCRYLFLSGEQQVLDRVRLLLEDRPAPESSLPAVFGGHILLPEPPPLEHIGVTALSAYLRNPFRFYLERLLRWEPPEPLPMEMDAAAFGNLAHKVLEALNGTPEGLGLSGGRAVREFLHHRLDAEVAALYGSRPPVAVRIQADSLRERLSAAAEIIAGEREKGWLPERVEWSFDKDFTFTVDGLPLRGKIDLLERNTTTGEYRIIDYKTSDAGDAPAKVHVSSPNAASAEPLFPECDFMVNGKRQRWKDLQLPLYQVAVERHTGGRVTTGYLCLAKAVSNIRLETWDPGPQLGTAALDCAEAIVRLVRAGYFPLAGSSAYDDPWLPWFGGDYEASIHPDWLARHTEARP